MPKAAAQLDMNMDWAESIFVPEPVRRHRRNVESRAETAQRYRRDEEMQTRAENDDRSLYGDRKNVRARAAGKAEPRNLKRDVLLTLRDKVTMITVLVIGGMVFIAMVFLSMYTASIQKDINKTNAKTAVLQEDVENLQLVIEQKKNIASIEVKAKKLGMIYPAAKDGELIYLDDLKNELDEGKGQE